MASLHELRAILKKIQWTETDIDMLSWHLNKVKHNKYSKFLMKFIGSQLDLS